jgi:hypothetical protein
MLVLPVEPLALLQDGFWPITRFTLDLEDQFIEDGSVCKEYDENDHFIGHRQDYHAPFFQVSRNFYEGYFVVFGLQMAIINCYGLQGQNLILIVT